MVVIVVTALVAVGAALCLLGGFNAGVLAERQRAAGHGKHRWEWATIHLPGFPPARQGVCTVCGKTRWDGD